MRSEEEIRQFAAALIGGISDAADEEALCAEPELAVELERRLMSCGMRLVRSEGVAPFAVIEGAGETLSELSLACLALACVGLNERSGRRPRLDVKALWERVGKPAGYSEAYLRRAGIGPLEQRGFLKVVKPEQRAGAAYVVPGPAFKAIDIGAVKARIERMRVAA